MILCDGNLWLALALSGHVHHHAASSWLETVDRPESICLCRATQQTFLRLLTNSAVLAPYGNPPLTNNEAWAAYQALLSDDRIVFQGVEPPELESIWRQLACRDSASPKLWMDAYLAAFALAGGLTMVTTDRGFTQFSGLELLLIA